MMCPINTMLITRTVLQPVLQGPFHLTTCADDKKSLILESEGSASALKMPPTAETLASGVYAPSCESDIENESQRSLFGTARKRRAKEALGIEPETGAALESDPLLDVGSLAHGALRSSAKAKRVCKEEEGIEDEICLSIGGSAAGGRLKVAKKTIIGFTKLSDRRDVRKKKTFKSCPKSPGLGGGSVAATALPAACAPPAALSGVNFWSPDSKESIRHRLRGMSKDAYTASFESASAAVEDYGVTPPSESALKALELNEISWDDLIEHLIHQKPHQFIYRRVEAKALVLSLPIEADFSDSISSSSPMSTASSEGSVTEVPRVLSRLRKSHLKNPSTSPCKAYWSPPKIGIFTKFCDFIRERFEITAGRNVAMAITKDAEGTIIYTVASTDGPPGGTHAELLAWDLLPKEVKDVKKGVIFTERQPCCSGSNCNAKMKESLPEVAIVYTQPYSPAARSFLSMGFLSDVVTAGASSGVEST